VCYVITISAAPCIVVIKFHLEKEERKIENEKYHKGNEEREMENEKVLYKNFKFNKKCKKFLKKVLIKNLFVYKK
jgi:hypothetical protein